ncbi:MAG TPA: serine hydrolase domain-containing protein [Pseudonocardiaceae bacterium]
MNGSGSFRIGHRTRRHMHRALIVFIASLVAVAVACGTSPRAAPESARPRPVVGPSLDAPMAQKLDQVIERKVQQTGVPGVIVGVWSPTGSYVHGFGVADKATHAPMSPDMLIRIGSETKTFTVTGLLQLVDQGRVALDDPISKYVAGVPQGDRITLRELARMQSGLFNYSNDEQFDRRLLAAPFRPWTPAELLAVSFSHPLVFPPGQGWQYSNTNTVLLGLVVEQVSGQPLPDYLQKNVFGPLGLTRTSFPDTNAFPEPHPQGYTTESPGGPEAIATDWDPSWAWAAGAMISDLKDLRTWAPALATGRLLKPTTQAERLQTVTPPGFSPQAAYGLGLFEVAGWIGHNGSLPGYHSRCTCPRSGRPWWCC